MPSTLAKIFGIAPSFRPPQFFREGASQTYSFGDLVCLAANLLVAAAAAGNNLDSTGNSIVGVVQRAGRNGANPSVDLNGVAVQDVPVMVADDSMRFLIPFWSATPANAVYSNALIGQKGVLRNVGGVYVFNQDVTANANLEIVDKEPSISPSDTYDGVWVKVLQSARALG